ncbi:hypothetical protein NQ318_015601 [Aromia moschata]|uniref:Peptidase aspartic putative domain-containing protein n=1 Tax=Aromia moschata TaxID=1265417 RepID=A0AAV8XQS1_9CUCU|nr:hypothetical protein NQ318_015601 [Aromia moschata]
MKFPVKQWDFILFNMLFDRLDKSTATRFELSHDISSNTEDSFEILLDFLDKQCDAQSKVALSRNFNLKAADLSKSESKPRQYSTSRSVTSTSLTTNTQMSCPLCKADHSIYHCPNFLMKSPQERFSCAKTNKWCTNCLGHKHSVENCLSRGVCRKCSKKHNTLLHFSSNAPNNNSSPSTSQPNTHSTQSQASSSTSLTHSPHDSLSTSNTLLSHDNSLVLLSTAVVGVLNGHGQFTPVRALIDSASDSNYISSRCANKLGLARRSSNISVCGIVREEDRSYQKILWRFSKDDPVQTFVLNTVTYGMNCSPFLAIRTLLQLAKEFKNEFPIVSKILETDVYVDDVLSGSNSLNSALEVQQELISLLNKGCFELRKWASNHPGLLTHLPSSSLPFALDSETDSTVKILGLQWSPSSDSFIFKITPLQKICTKRSMLSDLARIFDPLGFLTPLTLYLKFIIQQLWARNTDWDSPPSDDIFDIWTQFKQELSAIQDIHIPRHIIPESYIALELHGFCDASSRDTQRLFICALLYPLVAPLKSISIPRLELCSALLLSELMNFVLSLFEDHITISKVYAWSDSTITLAWINSSPHRWGTFVCNRVTKIHENVPSSIWRHISSQDNPADPASRGLLPSALISNSLWFSGPRWLSMSSEYWPTLSDIPETDEEKHHVTLLSVENQTPSKNTLSELIEKYSSLSKIQPILAYILRFLHNLKHAQAKQSGYLSRSELENSLTLLIKNVQEEEFSTEIYRLKSQRPLQRTFKKLTPFLDKSGVLRVGGRLMHLLAQCISDYFGLSQLQCTSVTPAGISASEGKHPRAYRPWEIAAYGRKRGGPRRGHMTYNRGVAHIGPEASMSDFPSEDPRYTGKKDALNNKIV